MLLPRFLQAAAPARGSSSRRRDGRCSPFDVALAGGSGGGVGSTMWSVTKEVQPVRKAKQASSSQDGKGGKWLMLWEIGVLAGQSPPALPPL